MRVEKILKYALAVSMSFLFAALAWLFFDYLQMFSLFPIISFLALLSYTLFVIRLYLNNVAESKLLGIHWLVLFILVLPAVIGSIQFFDTHFFENYWPVVITLITIQSILGIMAGFGFFITRKSTPTIVNVVVLISGLFGVGWSFLVLSKSMINEVKTISFYVLLIVTFTIVIGNIIVAVRKRS